MYEKAWDVFNWLFSCVPSPSFGKVRKRLKGRKRTKENLSEVVSVIKKKSIQEIAQDIRKARDKALEGEKLSRYEAFLYDRFLNMGASTVEELARKLKKEILKKGERREER